MDKSDDIRAIMNDLVSGLHEFENTHYAVSLDLKLDFSELVIKGLRKKKWTYKQLAEAIKTKDAYINRVVHADQNCTLDVIGRICYALGVKPRLINLYETEIFSKPIIVAKCESTINESTIKFEASYGQETISTHSAIGSTNSTYRFSEEAAYRNSHKRSSIHQRRRNRAYMDRYHQNDFSY